MPAIESQKLPVDAWGVNITPKKGPWVDELKEFALYRVNGENWTNNKFFTISEEITMSLTTDQLNRIEQRQIEFWLILTLKDAL